MVVIKVEDWLKSKPKDIKELKASSDETLEGELKIDGKDFPELETIVIKYWEKNKETAEEYQARKGKISEVIIKDCKKLKFVNLAGNEIKKADFSGSTNLEELNVSNNKLEKIDVRECENLQRFFIFAGKMIKKEELEGWEDLKKVRLMNSSFPIIPTQELKNLRTITTDLDLLDGKGEVEPDKIKKYKEGVTKGDYDKINQKVQDYEKGLKEKLGLNDNNLATWKEEIEKLKNRPTAEQIKAVLGLQPNDPLPSDWNTKLVPKTDFDKAKNELDGWKNKFPGENPDMIDKKLNDAKKDKTELDEWHNKFPSKTPDQVEKDIKDLQSKPSGSTLTTEQQQKLNDYEKMEKQKKWLLDYLKEMKSSSQYAKIEQQVNNIK